MLSFRYFLLERSECKCRSFLVLLPRGTKFCVSVTAFSFYYTGRFIMYSGITKIYYRETIGHVFTKTVQIEITKILIFPTVRCFSSLFTFMSLVDSSVYSEKMASPGEKFCVLEYHTSKFMCNVHFVQSTRSTRLQTRSFVCGVKFTVCASRNQVVAH